MVAQFVLDTSGAGHAPACTASRSAPSDGRKRHTGIVARLGPTCRHSIAASLAPRRRPVAIAHRGGSTAAPENTLPAFAHAVALGVDAIECDVQLSRRRRGRRHSRRHARPDDRIVTGPVAALTAPGARPRRRGPSLRRRRWISVSRPRRWRAAARRRACTVRRRCRSSSRSRGTVRTVLARVLEVMRAARRRRPRDRRRLQPGVLAAVRGRAPGIVTSGVADRSAGGAATVLPLARAAPARVSAVSDAGPASRTAGAHAGTSSASPRRAGLPVHAWIVDEPTRCVGSRWGGDRPHQRSAGSRRRGDRRDQHRANSLQ